MRLLLFFISAIFSFIFYSFYNLQFGKSIFGASISYQSNLQSISGNLIFETIIFLLIALYFFLYFSPHEKIQKIRKEQTLRLYYFFFYLIFIIIFLFSNIYVNFYVFATLLFFLFSDLSFNLLGQLKFFEEQKRGLRYFGLLLNYISSILSMVYLFSGKEFSFYLVFILIFNIVFNYGIHKKYSNYVSLGVSILIIFFFLYYILIKLLFIINLFLN